MERGYVFLNDFVLEVTHIMSSVIVWEEIVTLAHLQQRLPGKALLGISES